MSASVLLTGCAASVVPDYGETGPDARDARADVLRDATDNADRPDVPTMCADSLILCGSECVSARFDPRHCGGCNRACPMNSMCNDGRCVGTTCPGGQRLCSGRCVDVLNDPANCGGCDTRCPEGVCMMGICPVRCMPGQVLCNGRCADTLSDISNCGGCNRICPRPTNGSAICQMGTCTVICAPERTQCGTQCVDTLNDASNCGACGRRCGAGMRCAASTCTIGATGPAFQITALTTDLCVTQEHNPITGDDRGGIAVSATHVLYTGDTSTGSFPVADIGRGVALGMRLEGLTSNLRDGTIWMLAPASGALTLPLMSVSIVRLAEIDGASGRPTGRTIPLSTAIPVEPTSRIGIFAGYDRVVVLTGTTAFDISLPSGAVTNWGPFRTPTHQDCESYAFWGTAEMIAGELWVDYVQNSTTIVRTRIPDGLTTPIARAMSLSDMCSFTVSPGLGRWFFHHEGTSQFGAFSEAIGSCIARFSVPTGAVTRYDVSPGSVAAVNVCSLPGATRMLAGADDVVGTAVPLPFPFRFYGTPYTAVRPTSNGYILFGSLAQMYDNAYYPTAPLPAMMRPRAAAFIFNSDLWQRAGVCVATVGTAPNRRFLVGTEDASLCCGDTQPQHYIFQIALNEVDDTLDYVYSLLDHGPMGTTANFLVGVQNADATLGTTINYSMGGPPPMLPPGTSLHLTPVP